MNNDIKKLIDEAVQHVIKGEDVLGESVAVDGMSIDEYYLLRGKMVLDAAKMLETHASSIRELT